MRFKKGVSCFGVRAEMLLALQVAESVYLELAHQGVTVTSITDGHHGSIVHGVGCGIDLRTRFDDKSEQWSGALKSDIVASLKDRLTNEFDVVLESNHIHIELDRR